MPGCTAQRRRGERVWLAGPRAGAPRPLLPPAIYPAILPISATGMACCTASTPCRCPNGYGQTYDGLACGLRHQGILPGSVSGEWPSGWRTFLLARERVAPY